MKGAHFLLAFALLALASSFASANDPSPLQDICVAVKNVTNGVFVNGKFCQDPELAKPEDFFFSGLDKPGNTSNRLYFNETTVNVDQIPGLNTLGISAIRLDFAPYGLNPPHIHPRASEILLVLEGTLQVGFLTGNRLISKVLKKGDVFVFPIGLIHYQFNPGKTNAFAISALNSQNPGEVIIPDSIFGAKPSIDTNFLAKAFQLNSTVVKDLQGKSWD